MREMNDAGKSSVRVNGRIATASYVREIGDADRRDRRPARSAAAAFAGLSRRTARSLRRTCGNRGARRRCCRARRAAARAREELRALHGDERRAQERYDDARFALDEIEGAAPRDRRGRAPHRAAALPRQRRAHRRGAAHRARGARRRRRERDGRARRGGRSAARHRRHLVRSARDGGHGRGAAE